MTAIKSMGGHFSAFLESRKNKLPGIYGCESARSSLCILLKVARAKRVFVPNYICDAVPAAVQAAGAQLVRYSIDDEFKPAEIFDPSPDDWILLVNFFLGFAVQLLNKLLNTFLLPVSSLIALKRTFVMTIKSRAKYIRHVNSCHPPLAVGIASVFIKFFRRIPVVYDVQDMWPDTLRATGMLNSVMALRLVGRVCRWVYRRVEHIVVLSPGFRRLLVERGVPESKLSVIYNWADEASLAQIAGPLPPEFPLAHCFFGFCWPAIWVSLRV